jgi:outer membrane receptor protein involved in Fe transport
MRLIFNGIFIPFITLLSFTTYAQKGPAVAKDSATQKAAGKLSGKLIDADNKEVSYATVTLLRADKTVANGSLSDDNGNFTITPTGYGTFTLRISAIGMEPKNIPDITITSDAANKNLGKIKVSSSATKLKEVNVVGEKPIMEMKVDKKVFNVEKNTTTAGGSASDVLQNVPSVSVDVDGTVSLRGKQDVTILIDGKPATLLGTDAASALQSLPASSIESVEVITNPSAKYDAQGLTGIINIITKKDGRLGINGYATIGAGTADKYNGNLGLNARKGKWNVFLNSNARLNSNYNRTTTQKHDMEADSMYIYGYEHSQRHFNGFFNSLGATYDFDKNHSITFTQNINRMNFSYKDPAYNNAYTGMSRANLLDSTYRYSQASGGPLSFSTSLDYKAKLKKPGAELSIDATFATTTIQRTQQYQTVYDSMYPAPNNMSTKWLTNQNAPGHGGNSSFNAWADYTVPLFTKNGKLGAGVKTQFYWFNSVNSPLVDSNIYSFDTTLKKFDVRSSNGHMDSSLYNNFQYNQQIHAAYLNWSDQLGKFSYQLGLRAEYSKYSGSDYAITNQVFENSFPLSLFPSAFVTYQLPAQQSVYLNYSRRINRPSFWDLMPFLDRSNPSVISQGNPGVVPEFIQNLELSYNKQTDRGDNIILSTYYHYTQNLIARVDTPIAGTSISYRKPYNLASGTTYGLELTGRLQLTKIWDATISGNLFQNMINVGNNTYSKYLSDQKGMSWISKANTNIKLPANFSIQLNGNYESPKVIAQGNQDQVWWVDAAVRKNFWKNKATLVVNCSDIFNTRKYTSTYNATYNNMPIYNQTIYRDRETRVGNITFTYRFGKSDFGKTPGADKKKEKPVKDTAPIQKDDRENNLKGDDKDDQGGGQGGGQNGGGQNGGGKPAGGGIGGGRQ